MKFSHILPTLAVILYGCLTSASKSLNQWTNREGNVSVETCSRGCYQFILQPAGRDSTQRFYITNFPDSLKTFALNAHNDQQKLHVFFSGNPTHTKQTIQRAGADDRPVPLYELPVLQLVGISRFSGTR